MNQLVVKHKLILLSIRKALAEGVSVYEATQLAWKTNKERAEAADYVLAHSENRIVGVFIADKWMPANDSAFGQRALNADGSRIGFVGREAATEIKELYLGKELPDGFIKRGAANPVRFLSPETDAEDASEAAEQATGAKLVSLTIGMAIPTMVEDGEDLLLEAGDGIEDFRFPETEDLDLAKLSQWVFERIEVVFDGSLDDADAFITIRCVGISEFGESDAEYDQNQGLILSNLEVYLEITPPDDELSEEALDDLFHLVVLRVIHENFEMTYTEYDDYSVEEIESIEHDYKKLDITYDA